MTPEQEGEMLQLLRGISTKLSILTDTSPFARMSKAEIERAVDLKLETVSLGEVCEVTGKQADSGTNIGEVARAIEDKKRDDFERNYEARAEAIAKAAKEIGVIIR
ncbi:hypothetical protein NTE_02107 [Candidatus Nitrososphaera evergladensis SR1]|uniref:Uncharacterized protein n=1 Tax=Candidatus Nitrososphaera evergladensis SR1 TaxID=1459636 RepID=A0A075MTS0_9ARCH|nr:hypothetical protein [Candidatus Nitrososphaera evergladensis]AIF84162.1 hypothetical protein NTE_02107 [Candidatus Nitrososphaera evergladensis SR1]